MPEMDGGKTFDRIRNLLPEMPVLLSSGYAINGQATEIIKKGCHGFIQKPFNLSQLSQKIRQILSEKK
jgi:CheY-like chemotaxis protein